MPRIERYITKSLNFPNKQDPNQQYHRGITSRAHGGHLLHSDRRQLSPAVAARNICILTFALCSKLVHNTTIHPLRFLSTPTTWHSPQICCGCDQKKLRTMRGRVDSVAIVTIAAIAPVIRMMHLTCASHAPMLPYNEPIFEPPARPL